MKKITFISRPQATMLVPPDNCALISVHDISEEPLTPQPGWDDVLHLRFHDTDGSILGLELFNEGHARKVLSFVQEHLGVEQLFVNCQAGQSRSAAIALFLADVYGVPCFKGGSRVTLERYAYYNRLVFTTLYRQAYGQPGQAFFDSMPA